MKRALLLAVAVLIGVSFIPVDHSDQNAFANPAFRAAWSTRSTAAGAIDIWGSEPLLWRVEPYAEAPDGRRLVQYFDRGRMELVDDAPAGAADRITQGLLAEELVTGQIRLGDTLVEARPSPNIAIDSGRLDDSVPTYAALAGVTGSRAGNRTGRGEVVTEWIDGHGNVSNADPPRPVRLAGYEEVTGHNVPDVTVDLLSRQPFGGVDSLDALGYPISEPFWTVFRRDEQPLPSLIQVFQRRILVYTPSLPVDEQWTVTNIGRHYYRWRYGDEAPAAQPTPQAGAPGSSVIAPLGFAAGIYADSIGTPVGLAVGPAGELWIATRQGEIIHVDSETADGRTGRTTVFAAGLANPRGLVVSDRHVYVTTDDGLIRLDDNDGNGIADARATVTSSVIPAAGPKGAPVMDPAGRILVAGTVLPDHETLTVVAVHDDGTIERLSGPGTSPGPLLVAQDGVYQVRRDPAEDSATIFRLPLDGAGGVIESEATPIATFSAGTDVNALLMIETTPWPGVPPHTLLAAVSDGDGGKIIRLAPRSDGSPPELVDFVTGLSEPIGVAAGLDGSLYIADAARQEVVKVVPKQVTPP